MKRSEWFADYYASATISPRAYERVGRGCSRLSALESAKAQYVAGTIELHAFEVKVAHILARGDEPESQGHDWHDGRGPVHSIPLAAHRANLIRRVTDSSRKHLM